jgi:hypothetical protein
MFEAIEVFNKILIKAVMMLCVEYVVVCISLPYNTR